MPGFLVHHQLLEITQTHVHWVSDAFQPSHPLSSPSPPASNLSQHQGLFKWVSSSHQVAKVLVSASAPILPMNIQDWFPLGWTGWISLQPKGLSRVFSKITVQKAIVVLLTSPPSWTYLVLISLCHVLRLCLSFRDFALTPSYLFHFWLRLLSYRMGCTLTPGSPLTSVHIS